MPGTIGMHILDRRCIRYEKSRVALGGDALRVVLQRMGWLMLMMQLMRLLL